MSKVGKLSVFLKGLHVMGNGPDMGLKAYHDARKVVNAGRMRDPDERFSRVRSVLKNYRVTVVRWPAGSEGISIRRTTNGDGDVLPCPQSYNM